ncbi:hypothetical protein MAR_013330 [Mya arenaria]|uniref:Uncharacterized protein n=1 Tax=Mya arenaria TaxID=6604 RepID=A0ABY7G8P9_MYAAR|nr:hypothetical protein MAR_013330 [Mya arenaria]
MRYGHVLQIACILFEVRQAASFEEGEWTEWSHWSECSVTCGYGLYKRQKTWQPSVPDTRGGGDNDPYTFEDILECITRVSCPPLSDNFDVHLCNETTYMCLSQKQCIPAAKRCDNVLQCHDGSDEHNFQCKFCEHISLDLDLPGDCGILNK